MRPQKVMFAIYLVVVVAGLAASVLIGTVHR